MTTSEPVLSPRRRQSAGCSVTAVAPDLPVERATALSMTAKALADPTRLQILDVVRKSAPEAVCQCELLPLFAMTQAGLAKHLGVLVDAGILASQRRGAWTYYYPRRDGTEDLTAWLSLTDPHMIGEQADATAARPGGAAAPSTYRCSSV